MKRLYISMVVAVLGALFIINWGLDKLVAKQGNEHENTELVVYQKLVDGFEQQLSNVKTIDLIEKTNQLAQYYKVNVSLESTENIAMTRLLVDLYGDTLIEENYDAELAGIH